MMLMMLLMNDGYSGSEEGADLSQQEARFDQVTERYLKSICLSGINFTAQPQWRMIMIARFLFPCRSLQPRGKPRQDGSNQTDCDCAASHTGMLLIDKILLC